MSRLILPLLIIAAAVGLFVLYTDPAYQAAQALNAQVSQYNDALTKSQELQSVRNQLLAKRATFSNDDVAKLQEVLPDNVDNIRLIIDINNIAAHHNLALQNVQLDSSNAAAQSALSSGSVSNSVGSVTVGFSVTTDYNTMLAFLQDLEHSLRLIDVQTLSFASGGSDHDSYTFRIQTYWLH